MAADYRPIDKNWPREYQGHVEVLSAGDRKRLIEELIAQIRASVIGLAMVGLGPVMLWAAILGLLALTGKITANQLLGEGCALGPLAVLFGVAVLFTARGRRARLARCIEKGNKEIMPIVVTISQQEEGWSYHCLLHQSVRGGQVSPFRCFIPHSASLAGPAEAFGGEVSGSLSGPTLPPWFFHFPGDEPVVSLEAGGRVWTEAGYVLVYFDPATDSPGLLETESCLCLVEKC